MYFFMCIFVLLYLSVYLKTIFFWQFRKKEQAPVSKKDKMVNCNLVADCISAPNMRYYKDTQH